MGNSRNREIFYGHVSSNTPKYKDERVSNPKSLELIMSLYGLLVLGVGRDFKVVFGH